MNRKKSTIAAVAALFASVAFAVGSGGSASAGVAGTNGLIDIPNGQQCGSGVDAFDSAWNWEKPLVEVSTDSGATFASAQGSTSYGAFVCRDTGQNGGAAAYWFVIMNPSSGSDDLGTLPPGVQFRVTVPMKAGDTALRLMGYSKVMSLAISSDRAVAIVKESPVAKIDMGNGNDFFNNHPECAGLASSPGMAMSICKIRRADRDRTGTVIQHITYTSSTPSAYDLLTQGTWLGANVNGFNLNMTCGSNGSDSNGNSGGNYNGGNNNDGGANIPTTATSGSLEVSMSGTPHFRADGTTINTGNLQAFVTEKAARKCLGDGTDTIALSDIARAVSVTRTESSENSGAAQNVSNFTATAVTSPVAGLQIDVPEMTFSNPTYRVKSTLVPTKIMKKGKTATLKSILKPTTGARNVKYSVKGSACSIKGSTLVAKKLGTCTVTLKQTIKSKVNGRTVSKTYTSTKKIKVS